ncbi:MAG: hypothetical protein BWY59_00825 [Verrucomicrobia bacterium ADurb.Bin345]|nr:MAG: hypothetical protein BWY59_00825 [Verrucomicrobia bacterium ADurb.Bin345]
MRVHGRICGVVIGLLEHLVRSQPDLVQHAQFVNRQRGRIDIDAPNLAVSDPRFDLHIVDRSYGLGHVIDRGFRMLAIHDDQALVADPACQHLDFAPDFLLGEDPAGDGRVLAPKTAVEAVVDAHVAEVQGSKCHDAVVVDLSLDSGGGLLHFFPQIRIRDIQQGRRFRRFQRLHFFGLRDDLADSPGVGIRARPDAALDLRVVNEVAATGHILLHLDIEDALGDAIRFNVRGRRHVAPPFRHNRKLSPDGTHRAPQGTATVRDPVPRAGTRCKGHSW